MIDISGVSRLATLFVKLLAFGCGMSSRQIVCWKEDFGRYIVSAPAELLEALNMNCKLAKI